MTEHTMRLNHGEVLICSTCGDGIIGPNTVQLVADPRDDEQIADVLCRKCSDKRGE